MNRQHERRPVVSVHWRDGYRVIRLQTGGKWIEFYAVRLPDLIEALVNEQHDTRVVHLDDPWAGSGL